MTKIAPSILAADFTKLGEDIHSISDAEYLHFDVMDGCFVPNISFGLPVLEAVRPITSQVVDVHLMITKPINFVERFAKAGADIVCFHLEADEPQNIAEAIEIVKGCGKRVGLALKPKTPGELLLPYLPKLDLALVMTVEPGFGGQKFMADQMEKVSLIRRYLDEHDLTCDLEVDGGVNPVTAAVCRAAGADVLVAGSDLFRASDRALRIRELRG